MKRGKDPFNTSFNSVPINLFGRLLLIGWLSESEGVLEAEARMITATREIEKS